MTNLELEKKLQEIYKMTNSIDKIEALVSLKKLYKKTDLYKHTKISFAQMLKMYAFVNPLNWDNIKTQMQDFLDHVNLDNVQDLLTQLESTFAKENAEIQDAAELFKSIMPNIK